jgi:copper homeostasis protein
MIWEACVETLEEAVRAANNGAHRIELCSRLETGGLTPSAELISACMAALSIPVMVMIRPRAGDFVYDEAELAQMRSAIDRCKSLKVAGVVFGILTPERRLDQAATRAMAAYAAPLPCTFHKAIDEIPDIPAAVRQLVEIPGIRRILSSGGKETAREGAVMLRRMMDEAKDRLTIIVAGRVTLENRDELVRLTGARECHGRKIVG